MNRISTVEGIQPSYSDHKACLIKLKTFGDIQVSTNLELPTNNVLILISLPNLAVFCTCTIPTEQGNCEILKLL